MEKFDKGPIKTTLFLCWLMIIMTAWYYGTFAGLGWFVTGLFVPVVEEL